LTKEKRKHILPPIGLRHISYFDDRKRNLLSYQSEMYYCPIIAAYPKQAVLLLQTEF